MITVICYILINYFKLEPALVIYALPVLLDLSLIGRISWK